MANARLSKFTHTTNHNDPPGHPLWRESWGWKDLIGVGIAKMLMQYQGPSDDHTRDTPDRMITAFEEYFAGCNMDPKDVLNTTFPANDCDEMITQLNIGFVSFCSHHLVPFFGNVHFAYVPEDSIVGLSKISRLVEVYAKRPQVQETLTVQIAKAFMEIVEPKGCGVVIEAQHLCMCIRGVKKSGVITRTSALRGIFKEEETTKQEFLNEIPKREGMIWL